MWLHKVSLSSAGLQSEFEDRCYRFAMEAIDHNNVSDMEKINHTATSCKLHLFEGRIQSTSTSC